MAAYNHSTQEAKIEAWNWQVTGWVRTWVWPTESTFQKMGTVANACNPIFGEMKTGTLGQAEPSLLKWIRSMRENIWKARVDGAWRKAPEIDLWPSNVCPHICIQNTHIHTKGYMKFTDIMWIIFSLLCYVLVPGSSAFLFHISFPWLHFTIYQHSSSLRACTMGQKLSELCIAYRSLFYSHTRQYLSRCRFLDSKSLPREF